MQEQQIAEIKESVAQLLRFIQESGDLSDEQKMFIAQALDHASSRIQQLRSEQQLEQETPAPEQPSAEPEIDKLNMSRPMPSSNVHSFAYDPKNQKLFVRFQDKYPRQDGPVYEYGGVPEDIFNMFQRGAIPAKTKGQNKWGRWWVGKQPSLGASLSALIKTAGYPYQRVG